jgi:hypothetical protein
MMKLDKKFFHLFFSVVLGLWLVAGIFFVSTFLFGCKEECLAWGENCTQAYKQAEYGTTAIQCCTGQCTDHGSGILTCGS